MMLGEANHQYLQHHALALDVPPWPHSPAAAYEEPQLHTPCFSALMRFLPSNEAYGEEDELSDIYSSDEFRMYDFKVRRCTRGRSHDWTECPYAHPGEKARRRDPRKYHYSGTACPDFRKGSCKKGDSCDFAHGVFECWLHPSRYRTQPCKDGTGCRRRVCFFAHTAEQLRVVAASAAAHSPRSAAAAAAASDSYDGSPMRQQQHHLHSLEAFFPKSLLASTSPTSTLVSPPISPPSASPPLSPSQPVVRRQPAGVCALPHVNDVLASLRQLQLSKWGSPRASGSAAYCAVPAVVGCRALFDGWEEPVERVESGRGLRARIAEKLTRENCMERSEDAGAAPDVGWVSDLLN